MISRRVMMQAAGVAGLGLMVPSLQASQDVRNENITKRMKDYREAIECAKKPEVSIAVDRITSEIINRLNLKLFNSICPKIQLPQAWGIVKQLLILGDCFLERGSHNLPPDSMWKIVTTKGKVIQYQQGLNPDYQSIAESTRSKTNIVFQPSQIKHLLLNTVWMYGVTSVFVIEHNLVNRNISSSFYTKEELEEDLIQWYVKDLTKQLND